MIHLEKHMDLQKILCVPYDMYDIRYFIPVPKLSNIL